MCGLRLIHLPTAPCLPVKDGERGHCTEAATTIISLGSYLGFTCVLLPMPLRSCQTILAFFATFRRVRTC